MLKLITDEEIQKAWRGESVEPLAYGAKRIVAIYDPHKVAQAQLEAVKKELLGRIIPKPYLGEDDAFYYPIKLTEEEYQQLKGD